MDLNRVSAFVRVVQEGSFTSAARALGVPKSSVSRSVAQLEEDLGIRLLHRTTRKLHLTDAGSSYYERVSRALGEIDQATTAAADTQSELRGVVRISAPVDVGVLVLAPIIARFARKQPTIQVDAVLTGRVVDLVSESIDLAIRFSPLRDTSLVARRIGAIGLSLVASSKYIARRGEPRSLDDLAKHDCVLFRATSGKGSWALVHEDGRQASVSVSGPVAADDLMFVHRAVLAGVGIGLVPDFVTEDDRAKGRLVRVLPKWSMPGANGHVVYPSARFVPQRVVVFRDYLMKELVCHFTQAKGRTEDDGD